MMKEIDLEGLDPIEVGPFYPSMMEEARASRVQIPGIHQVNFSGSKGKIKNALKDILHSAGLQDVYVDIETSRVTDTNRNKVDVDLDIDKDQTQEIINYLEKNPEKVF